jgi:CRP/FNR family cyclic AMP-dependent transcriptional regulator
MTTQSDAFFTALRPLGVLRSVAAKQIVMLQGDPADTLYLIEAGRVRVFLNDPQGREVTLNTLGAGECFGEMMLAHTTRTASVQTLSACRFCVVGRERLVQAIAGDPQLALHLIGTLIARVSHLTRGVSDLAMQSVHERVVSFLCDHAEPAAGADLLTPALSLKFIAEGVGASRSMVHKVVHDLTLAGHMRREGDHFRLHPSIRSEVGRGT